MDDIRKIFDMLAAINARLDMNERLTRQIDEQLALLNLKREHELNALRTTLQDITAVVNDLKNSVEARNTDDLRAIRESFQSTADAVESIEATFALGTDNSAIVSAIDDLKADFAAKTETAALSTAAVLENLQSLKAAVADNTAIVGAIGDLKADISAKTETAALSTTAVLENLQSLTAAVDDLKNASALESIEAKIDAAADNSAIFGALGDLKAELSAKTETAALSTAAVLDNLQSLTAAVAELKNSVDAKDLDDLIAIRESFQSTADAVESLQVLIAAGENNAALVKSVDELKNIVRQSLKADDLVTLRMALQNTSIALNDIKKRVDGLKFDTTKRFNELNVNAEIGQAAVTKALNALTAEVTALAENLDHDTRVADSSTAFQPAEWWNGNENSKPEEQ